MHDLLQDGLISVRLPSGDARLSLPDLLAKLARGDVTAYTRLRRHQTDPFHVFTVQLAVSVMARAGLTLPPEDESFWREGLLELAAGNSSAWQLIEADPTKPAFMQSPCGKPEDFAAYKVKATSPDELDVLVTAKDHDVKMARARPDDEELWVAVLVTYQTLSGFLGAGNYGIVRMNGGFASRAMVYTVRDSMPGPRFKEEVPIVLEARAQALRSAFGYRPHGTVLTWLTPWDGRDHQHPIGECEPLFIEAPRRLRLRNSPSGLQALAATSARRQIDGPDNGDCGDPWTALNMGDTKKGHSALTLSGQGFTPKLLTDLLFQRGYELTVLQQPRTGAGTTRFCASVLVRGQGKTDGFHSVEISIPERARLMLLQSAEREGLGALAQDWLKDAADGAKCLRAALMTLIEGGPAETDFGKDTINKWVERSQQEYVLGWQTDYFPSLWQAAEPDIDLASLRAVWAGHLMSLARHVLGKAEQALPVPSARRLRARVRAEGMLENLFRKNGLLELNKGATS